MEDYLARRPAHIAAQRFREFEQTVVTLQRQWSQKEPGFRTTILPTAPVGFHTQFRSSSERISMADPCQSILRGPTGAENKLHR